MDDRIWIAFGAASTACLVVLRPRKEGEEPKLMPAVDGTTWPFMGNMPEAIPQAREAGGWAGYEAAFMERIAPLVDFVRTFPDAPLEALYRHARSCGVHDRPSDGFDDVPAAFRIAYAVFRATLIEADRVFLEEERRAAAKAAADRPQAPVMVPAEDTILEQHGSVMEKIGDRPAMVNLGGPAGAHRFARIEDFGAVSGPVTEGEGGDAAEHLEQPAGGAADQGHVDMAAAADGGGDAGVAAAEISRGGQHAGVDAPAEREGEKGGAPAPDDAAGAEGVATETAQPQPADGVDGAAAADPAPDPANDTPGAPSNTVKPAKKKR